MDFIYVVVVIGAPIGTGIYGFTVGQISALFALVMQVRSILASLSSSTEHMRIARYLKTIPRRAMHFAWSPLASLVFACV